MFLPCPLQDWWPQRVEEEYQVSCHWHYLVSCWKVLKGQKGQFLELEPASLESPLTCIVLMSTIHHHPLEAKWCEDFRFRTKTSPARNTAWTLHPRSFLLRNQKRLSQGIPRLWCEANLRFWASFDLQSAFKLLVLNKTCRCTCCSFLPTIVEKLNVRKGNLALLYWLYCACNLKKQLDPCEFRHTSKKSASVPQHLTTSKSR